MPRHCCVPGCNSNYSSARDVGTEVVPTFSFPRDPELRRKWILAIPRRNWEPTHNSVVCINHFHLTQLYKPGAKLIKLVKGVVPSLFPTVRTYSAEKPSEPCMTNPPEQREKRVPGTEKATENPFHLGIVATFENFVRNYKKKLNLLGWCIMESVDRVTFYILEENEETGCEISVRVVINRDLKVRVFLRDAVVPSKDLNWLLSRNSKLTLWSQIENLLFRYKFERDIPPGSCEEYIKKSISYLEKASNFQNDFEFAGKLEFLLEQIKLLLQAQLRYSTSTMIASFLISSISNKAYEQLRNFLSLPCRRYLQYISSSMHISSDQENTNNDEGYIRRMTKKLTDREKYVALLIDEIHIQKRVPNKSNNVDGLGEKNDLQNARSIVSIMIKSVCGSYKEIVRLIPVYTLTGEYLHTLTLDAIKFVQSLGLRVVVIITDNNRASQVMFQILSKDSNFFPNPDFETDKIFLLYDTIHLFKNFRNNWLNLKTEGNTFLFPDFESYEVKKASFEIIKDLYKREANLPTKKANKLNFKTLYPNNLERQNVMLVVNIFHDSTIDALKECETSVETADFCLILNKWWKIVSIKNSSKETKSEESWCEPFCSNSDMRIDFLKKFITWLDIWNQSEKNAGKLSPDTYKAAALTTQTIVDLIDYALNYLKMESVSPGELQTDDLESRFRLYRSLSGPHSKLSYSEVIEPEIQIRIQSVASLNAADSTNLQK